MTWRHVLRRDLTSVFRARIGASVLSFTLLLMVLPMWLVNPPDSAIALLAVLTLVTVVLMLVLAFLGRPLLVTGVAVLFSGVFLLVALVTDPGSPSTVNSLLGIIGGGLSFLVPVVALLGSYGAIVGERSTGSVRFLLGLPNSRTDAYVGKFLSRCGVVTAAVLLGIVLIGLVALAHQGTGALARLLGLGLVTVPYVVIFVGIGIAASARGETESHAVGMAVGVFALLRLGWPAIEWLFITRSRTGVYRETVLYYWFNRINPMNAYGKATSLLLEPAPGRVGNPFLPGTEEIVAPIAQSGAFAVAVLLAWAVLTPLVGYWVFTNRDAI